MLQVRIPLNILMFVADGEQRSSAHVTQQQSRGPDVYVQRAGSGTGRPRYTGRVCVSSSQRTGQGPRTGGGGRQKCHCLRTGQIVPSHLLI